MALYAIGDLHLSLGTDKPMDVFGGRWEGYTEKLRESFARIQPQDTTVLLGDLSWALGISEARKDFSFINDIPGRKILLKGNHDFWWTTVSAFHRFCEKEQFSDMDILHNNCFFYGDIAICGTRGWFYEEDNPDAHNEKVFQRELGRLEVSLKSAGEREKFCFLHYPPRYRGYECREILQLMKSYDVRRCYYGHLHAESHRLAMEGEYDGILYRLVSADYVNFEPVMVLD